MEVRVGGLFRVAIQTTSPRRQPVRNDEASVVPARHDGLSRVMSLQNAMAQGWSIFFKVIAPDSTADSVSQH